MLNLIKLGVCYAAYMVVKPGHLQKLITIYTKFRNYFLQPVAGYKRVHRRRNVNIREEPFLTKCS